MKKVRFNKLSKGDIFKDSSYNDSLLEFQFSVPNAGGYGGAKGEGTSAYVIHKEGFTVSLKLIHRKDDVEVFLVEPSDMRYLSETEGRIRETAKFVEIYANAEKRSDGENLAGCYPSSTQFGEHKFQRGDVVRDCYGRLGTVLGVDGHSIVNIGRVDYRVQVEDCGKKGVGIFRSDEITKVGKLDNVALIED